VNPAGLSQRSIDRSQTDDSSEESEACREAFLRIGFGHGGEEIDPRAVVQTFLSHEQMLKELDAQHSKDTERISQLQKQIVRSERASSCLSGCWALTGSVSGSIQEYR